MSILAASLLALGILLVVLEVFFPSLGVLAMAASAAIIGGAIAAYKDGGFGLYLGVAFVMIPIALVVAFKYFPKTPMGRRLTLTAPSFQGEDRQASERGLESLVGCFGESETALRPSGIAMIDGKRVDVVTRGTMIEAGTAVRVLKVEGNRVIVARDTESASEEAG